MVDRVRAASPPRLEAKVKGTLVTAVIKFLRARGMDPERVMSRLPEADRTVLEGILLPTSWYSRPMFARLQSAVAEASTGTRAECFRNMGQFSAQANFGAQGARRAFIHHGDPHYVLAAIPRFHDAVYSVGRRTYTRVGERAAIIRTYDDGYAPDHCFWTLGFLEGIVELSGGNEAHAAEARCAASGGGHCEYRVEWK